MYWSSKLAESKLQSSSSDSTESLAYLKIIKNLLSCFNKEHTHMLYLIAKVKTLKSYIFLELKSIQVQER